MKRYFLLVITFIYCQGLLAQGTIVGTVLSNQGNPIHEKVEVRIKKSDFGNFTDNKGKFYLEDIPNGSYTLLINTHHYQDTSIAIIVNNNLVDIGTIFLHGLVVGENELNQLAQFRSYRENAGVVYGYKDQAIQDGIGTGDLSRVFRSVPSVYLTDGGGGFGDSQFSLRGFTQKDIAVTFNGISLNSLENYGFNWSDWQALRDVSENIEIQTGGGNSPLAINSVGGTINISSLNPTKHFGGQARVSVGNDGYKRLGFTLNSGQLKHGWLMTFSGYKTWGDGFVEGTHYDAWTYYGNISKAIGDRHLLQFNIIGAPMTHGKRVAAHNVKESFELYGARHNNDFGFKDGKEYNLSEGFSHKPMISLNHYWTINNKSSLNTSIYYTAGRNGHTQGLGGVNGAEISQLKRDDTGHFNWDEISKYNKGETSIYEQRTPFAYELKSDPNTPVDSLNLNSSFIAFTDTRDGFIKYASMQENTTAGVLTTYTHSFSEFLTLSSGFDGRYSATHHYAKPIDLFGNEFIFDTHNKGLQSTWMDLNGDLVKQKNEFGNLISADDINTDLKGESMGAQHILYDYGAYITDASLFSRLDLKSNVGMFAFISGALSHRNISKVENFALASSDNSTEETVSRLGGNVRLGYHYNLDLNHAIFMNGQFISRQPRFNSLFPEMNTAYANVGMKNEKVFGGEIGYSYRLYNIQANAKGYYTYLMDRETILIGIDEDYGYYLANMPRVNASHAGIELDFEVRLFQDRFLVAGMLGLGDWKYLNTSTLTLRDAEREENLKLELYLKDMRMGNAARTTTGLTLGYEILNGLSVSASYRYYSGLYGDLVFSERTKKRFEDIQAIRLLDYGIADVNLSYAFKINNIGGRLTADVHNLFNQDYLSTAQDKVSSHELDNPERISGLNGFYGLGRTWSIGLSINF